MTKPTRFVPRDSWIIRTGERLVYAAAAVFLALTWLLPTRVISAAIAPLAGWVAFLVPGSRRRVMDNLELVWPDMPMADRRRLVRAAGRSFFRQMIGYTRLGSLARRPDRIAIEGAEVIERIKATGKGAVIVSAHYGHWEGVRIASKMLGLDCGIMYRAFNNRYIDRDAARQIAQCGEPGLAEGPAGDAAPGGAYQARWYGDDSG